MKIIRPVIEQPLLAEWQPIKASIAANMAKYEAGGKGSQIAYTSAQQAFLGFLQRLRDYRVLDPACGSGNFLYLALKTLKDLEHRVNLEAEALGLQRELNIETSPANVLGIELNPYAAELARVTVWIGEIQWMLSHGYQPRKDPILAPLDHIENRDAIVQFPSPSGRGARGEGKLGGEGTNYRDIPQKLIEYARELRHSQTDAENLLWMLLRDRRFLGLKFRRQHPLAPYILDFYCHEAKLAIELDGGQHAQQQDYDQKRDAHIQAQGIRVLRFWNNDVMANTESVLEALYSALTPTPLPKGEGFASEAEWPVTDAIVGNPPFLGGSKKRGELGTDYFNALSHIYKNRVPDGADLVTYWFEKAREHIEHGKASCAGLVATNSIRGGANRKVLERILSSRRPMGEGQGVRETLSIYEAWSDESWVNAGAAVRVSLICFGDKTDNAQLDGAAVSSIYADLTAGGGMDLTQAKLLKENAGFCFMGASKKAPLDIAGQLAREWLLEPNPNGRSNAEVLRPLANAIEITRRPSDTWVIDFGTTMPELEAALYEAPFQYVLQYVKPEREKNNREAYRKYWWRHAEARPNMRAALSGLVRYIATPAVAKHRLFVWLPASVLPDQAILATASDNDTIFGILHSRFHELWSLGMCTWMGVGNDPRYTPTTCFETFPFPDGLSPSSPALLPKGEGSNSRAHSGVVADKDEPHAATSSNRPSPSLRAVANEDESYEATSSNSPSPFGRGVGVREAIATVARRLDELRNNWLNPPEWVDWVITPEEEKAGYPKRPVAKPGFEAELKKRTLTNLYNQRPAWLDNIHKELDIAVADAYGWADYSAKMSDDEILRRLLQLNLARAGAQ